MTVTVIEIKVVCQNLIFPNQNFTLALRSLSRSRYVSLLRLGEAADCFSLSTLALLLRSRSGLPLCSPNVQNHLARAQCRLHPKAEANQYAAKFRQ